MTGITNLLRTELYLLTVIMNTDSASLPNRVISTRYPFSAVLIVFPLHSSKDFLLRRYNGRSHRHKNRIEGTQIDGFHIHYATERYQLSGFGEEAYAKLTDRYANLNDALRCLLKDANFEEPVGAQLEIFQEV